jgi:WD40 repeat protein
MNRIVALLLLATLPAAALAQQEIDRPSLVPNTFGHTSSIYQLLFTPDGKQLISVSGDKTIRIWDYVRGQVVRVLRPPIGTGREGMLFAAALSPDGKLLAVGGVPVGNGRFGYPIYLIRLPAGVIERSLRGHQNWIQGLAFSPDGKRLASASGDRTARIWDLKTGTSEKTLEGHTGGLRDVAWSPDGQRLATASFDKTARLWSAADGRSEAVLKEHEAAVQCVAWSPDGKTIATGSMDQTLILWEKDGRIRRKSEKFGSSVNSLAFSPDSASLLLTRGRPGLPDFSPLLLTVDTGKERVSFNGHTNATFAGALSPDMTYAATAGGAGDELFVWRTADGQPAARLGGPSVGLFSAAWSRDSLSVAWGTTNQGSSLKANKPLERTFRFDELEFGGPPNEEHLRAQTERGVLSLAPVNATTVAVKQADRTLSTLSLAESDYLRCFTFLDADRVAVGSQGLVTLFDVPTGRPIRKLVGHTTEVWAVAPAPNRRWLLSASMDQTLRLWDTQGPPLREGAVGVGLELKVEAGLPVVTAVVPDGPAAKEGRIHVRDRIAAAANVPGEFVEFKDRPLADVTRTLEGAAGSQVRMTVLPEGKDKPIEVTLRRASLGLERSEAFLSLFFAGNDWVAWIPEGYYASSPGGERLVGWHINNGVDQMASFYPADRFAPSLYRPDIISAVAETGNIDRAVALADLVRGQKTERFDIAEVLPPRVKITSPARASTELNEAEVEVSAEAEAAGKHPIVAMRLLVGGRPYNGLEGTRKFAAPGLKAAKAKWKVRLNPGPHRLVVQADTAVSQGDSAPVEVNYVLGTPPQGRLFVLAVGISAYTEDKLKLFYAAKDAQAVADRLKEKATPPFRDVTVRALTNREATRAAIREELKALQKQMKPEDTAVVFYSGHGERAGKSLYLMPIDVVTAKLKETGVSGDELKTALVNLPGLVLLVLDTCHAGAAGAGRLLSTSVSDDLARELGRDENGVIVMCSSMGRQESIEDNEHRQGTFTLAVLEGLAGKGSKGLDGVVYQHHLDSYVLDRVRQLTKGRQTPTTAKPGNLPPFPLSKP